MIVLKSRGACKEQTHLIGKLESKWRPPHYHTFNLALGESLLLFPRVFQIVKIAWSKYICRWAFVKYKCVMCTLQTKWGRRTDKQEKLSAMQPLATLLSFFFKPQQSKLWSCSQRSKCTFTHSGLFSYIFSHTMMWPGPLWDLHPTSPPIVLMDV